MALHTASRLLEQHPDIATENILTAIVCGDVRVVSELLRHDRALASERSGPRNWPPLLYLASARLLQPGVADHATEIARLLLEHGADPNAYYADGSDIPGSADEGNHFTVLTCILGRGEQQFAPHPRERELTALLMESGAEPYDAQGLYNVFADHGSRPWLSNDIVWLLELMHEHSLRRGRAADWKDPAWHMLSVGGHEPGAYHLLRAAVSARLLPLAEWMLEHGASANTRAANTGRAQYSLYEEAVRAGNASAMTLLARYGASELVSVSLNAYEMFIQHCLFGDRERARQDIALHPDWLHTPQALIIATRNDNAAAVTLLLELGVSPDIEEHRGRARALHAASFAGASRAARVLLAAGADADAREQTYGATPMSISIWAQRPHMTEILAPYSRDVFSLVFAGKVERVRTVLAEAPALAAALDAKGESLLMRLPDAEDDALALTELLLASGADPLLRNRDGVTADELAERRALLRVAARLRAAK
ncbi:MAG: hypothetical protein ABJB74_05480 [Gemmatimonas sp.]